MDILLICFSFPQGLAFCFHKILIMMVMNPSSPGCHLAPDLNLHLQVAAPAECPSSQSSCPRLNALAASWGALALPASSEPSKAVFRDEPACAERARRVASAHPRHVCKCV